MEQGQGWVKFFRSIVNWEWYDDANTFRMFFHLIVTANYETRLWKGRTIKRGQRLTTIRKLADELNIDEKTVQRCLRNLESTKEIKVEPSKSGTMITIRKYNDYQENESEDVGIIPTPAPTPAPTQPPTPIPTPAPTPAPTKQEIKNNKNNINTPSTRTREEVRFAPLNANDIAFADFYKNTFKTEFVWQENTSEAVARIVQSIEDKISEGGGQSDPSEMPGNITKFLEAVYRLGDVWLNERFTPSVIAKQFNQLYNMISNGTKTTRKGRGSATGVSPEYVARVMQQLTGEV